MPFFVIFSGESHAQYNSAYDSKGNVKSVETRRYEERENNRNIIINSNSSSSSSESKSSESSSDKWLLERRKAEAEKNAVEAKEAESRDLCFKN